ncbi:hypothetical protein MRB53_037570 [Persea americana]|nr:hypothetical protein MRB53_037570 [Persea americana]
MTAMAVLGLSVLFAFIASCFVFRPSKIPLLAHMMQLCRGATLTPNVSPPEKWSDASGQNVDNKGDTGAVKTGSMSSTPVEQGGATTDAGDAERESGRSVTGARVVSATSKPAQAALADAKMTETGNVGGPAIPKLRQSSQQTASTLMPPPPKPPIRPRSVENTAGSRSGLAVDRAPRMQPTASSLLSPSVSAKPAVARIPAQRQKVMLQPGHSPLDWAQLARSGKNLSGVPGFQTITPEQLAWHNGRKGRPAWSVWHGKVYNITPYLPFHPGGEPELLRAAGKNGEKLFNDVHPWVNFENMLESCLVGVLVSG